MPPADLPLNQQKPSPGPLDARRVVQYITRQIGDQVGPLCEWLLRRENQYVEAFGWTVEACVYAAARDAAGWQLNRSEAELHELLAGTEEITRRFIQRKGHWPG